MNTVQDATERQMVPVPSRPDMPKGYDIKQEGSGADLLPWERVTEWLTEARSYWIASTRPDGRPHVMPVWGLWMDGAVYFSTDPKSRKARNFARNPEIVVHLESGDNAVILEGTVETVSDQEILARFADAYDKKYHFRPDVSSGEGYYVLRPCVAFTWLESDFRASATRWQFGP